MPASQPKAAAFDVKSSDSLRAYRDMQMDLPQIRCGACHRKLGEGQYLTLVIKCPRCGALNHLKADEPLSPHATERHEPCR